LSELWTFIQLGFYHITNLDAKDHILFLLALAAIYRIRDWRDTLWVISAFTIGHSVTLVLAVTGALRLPSPLIEFLIPVTIVATCIENLLVRDHKVALWGGRYRPVFAGVFGLVHGAGFAGYLQNLFMDHIAVPLFGFNVGIELGQIVVLAFAFCALWVLDRVIALREAPVGGWSALRVRTVGLSAIIMMIAARWAVERVPW
jgi:hypothetical protein